MYVLYFPFTTSLVVPKEIAQRCCRFAELSTFGAECCCVWLTSHDPTKNPTRRHGKRAAVEASFSSVFFFTPLGETSSPCPFVFNCRAQIFPRCSFQFLSSALLLLLLRGTLRFHLLLFLNSLKIFLLCPEGGSLGASLCNRLKPF